MQFMQPVSLALRSHATHFASLKSKNALSLNAHTLSLAPAAPFLLRFDLLVAVVNDSMGCDYH